MVSDTRSFGAGFFEEKYRSCEIIWSNKKHARMCVWTDHEDARCTDAQIGSDAWMDKLRGRAMLGWDLTHRWTDHEDAQSHRKHARQLMRARAEKNLAIRIDESLGAKQFFLERGSTMT